MNDLTWACHICNEERPDAKISVLTKPLNIPGVISNENIRYCNDKPECVAGAQTFSFYKDKAEIIADWLSEFEQFDFDAVVLKPHWAYKAMLLMARVLRELAEFSKAYVDYYGWITKYWNNLSDDAKALLKAKREDDDRDND